MMASFRKEVCSLLAMVSLPTVLLLIFPFDCFRQLSVADKKNDECQICFVELTESEMQKVISSTRSSWQSGESAKNLKANLHISELPAMAHGQIGDVTMRKRTKCGDPVEFGFSSMPPSMAAEPQRKLTATADNRVKPGEVFSRKEMLELR